MVTGPLASGRETPARGVTGLSRRLHERLCQYLEAQIPLRDDGLVAERRALMEEVGALTREPYLETTPTYALGQPYSRLRLPAAVRDTLAELATWSPGVGVFPQPFAHQAAALEAFFHDGHDLAVASGTGSGKTETFLFPILGSLVQEATERPASFVRPGCRALLLYPMNALVQDQLVRLRRLLGDERVGGLFKARYGRPALFGTYTSRTPYAGQRTADRDRERIAPLLDYYLNLERAGTNATDHAVARELRERGRWPAKDLAAFLGTHGAHWNQRLRTSPHDRELLTRHEMHERCPDVLVTNYSMLEYMLMRPIERSMFEQTRDWLAADPRNTFLLVLDEAHVYRGTSGAEVALLIRRFQARLGIPRERLRCILTSASLGESVRAEQAVLAFADGLTGRPPGGSRFKLIRGTVEERPGRRPGTTHEAEALAALPLAVVEQLEEQPDEARQALDQALTALGLPALAPEDGESTPAALREQLAERLDGFGPLDELIVRTTGRATAFSALPRALFPGAPDVSARTAAEALLVLGSTASRHGRPLLATRAHLLFRGLPPLFACINPDCTERRDAVPRPTHLLGRLFATPRAACDCPRRARVYEITTHRDCGATFLRVYGQGPDAAFYWQQPGTRLHDDQEPLTEAFLLLEAPHPRGTSAVTPVWLEVGTGRAVTTRPDDPDGFRLVYRVRQPPTRARGKQRPEDDDPDDPDGPIICPACTRRTSMRGFGSLETRGERPFANLAREQLLAQPPARRADDQFPNAGRKLLLFSDGRQRAARLARDLPREVEHDIFRQALVLAARMRGAPVRPVRMDRRLFAAFVAVCARHRLHFFDGEDQRQLLRLISQFQRDYNGDLALALDEEWDPELLARYRVALLRLIADPYFALDRVGVGVVAPDAGAFRRLRTRLDGSVPPAFIEGQLEPLTRAWIQIVLRRGAFIRAIPREDRRSVREFYRPLPPGHRFRITNQLAQEWAGLDRDQQALLFEALYEQFTEINSDEGGAHLDPSRLALQIAVDDVWRRCLVCSEIQLPVLPTRCLRCGQASFEDRHPDDASTRARLDYFRAPIRAVLQGERPVHISAEEHTAQLSHRDVSAAHTTTEEYELRFQDVWLGADRPPVDVLSCTTTMEVGVDIGSLIAVGLRNVPPRRENYQQRAGRAGRRGAALSSVLTFAQSGPHDGYYFGHPEEIVAGDPREPMIAVDNRQLARRHINAYLVQHFFLEQIDRLSPGEQRRLEVARAQLFSALGIADEFFTDGPENPFTLARFRTWLDEQLFRTGAPHADRIGAWLPEEVAPPHGSEAAQANLEARRQLAVEAGHRLLKQLDEMSTQQRQAGHPRPASEHDGLLGRLFDEGLLPSYAFPVDLSSFVVFGVRNGKSRIVERPQQQKAIALSEYAPGRQLVIDKKTYRVGGIFLDGDYSGTPGRALFSQKLEQYVGCDECGYVRLGGGPDADGVCPVCGGRRLIQAELLDPPGFAPEGGMSIPEHDREEEMSFATSARLPAPVGLDRLDWHAVTPRLRVAQAPEQQLVTVNAGPRSNGFVVCEVCAAAWPAGSEPADGLHARPFPSDWGRARSTSGRCGGQFRRSLYLGYTFRTDLLVARLAVGPPLDARLRPWLLDACQSLVEALALAATRVLDVDPAELQPGFRLLPPGNAQPDVTTVDLFLYDTADGGAGYAAEAATRIETILEATLDRVTGCERGCRQSCTSCLRHYGNRFLQQRLDRHLAADLLRYLQDGISPASAGLPEQARTLEPLARYLALEGHAVQQATMLDGIGVPLLVRRVGAGSQSASVAVGVRPALLHDDDASRMHPLTALADRRKNPVVLLRDYELDRDLPTAYGRVAAVLTGM